MRMLPPGVEPSSAAALYSDHESISKKLKLKGINYIQRRKVPDFSQDLECVSSY